MKSLAGGWSGVDTPGWASVLLARYSVRAGRREGILRALAVFLGNANHGTAVGGRRRVAVRGFRRHVEFMRWSRCRYAGTPVR
jgi:threonine/homoserine/homoserine lactone efflux protein